MDTQNPSQPIALNCRVTVELVDSSGEAERREFTLVTVKQADFKSGLLDENTPLGRALLGQRAGEVVPYAVGDLREVRVLVVERGEGGRLAGGGTETQGGCQEGGRAVGDHQPDDLRHCQWQQVGRLRCEHG